MDVGIPYTFCKWRDKEKLVSDVIAKFISMLLTLHAWVFSLAASGRHPAT